MGDSGLVVDGNRNLGPSALRAPVIRGNLFPGHMLEFQGGARSLAGAEISVNAFTGTRRLRGGDFDGNNIVNLADYNRLRAVFPGVASVADITGDGYVNVGDYNILRANWLTAGDPQS